MGFMEGFVRGFVGAVMDQRIEMLAAGLASVGERKGSQLRLDFPDRFIGKRPLWVDDDGATMQFKTYGSAIIPAQEVPENIFAALLVWNTKLPFGKWQVEGSDDHDKLFFALDYCALSEGVNTGTFKSICEQMLKEAAEFDQRMKKAGVL